MTTTYSFRKTQGYNPTIYLSAFIPDTYPSDLVPCNAFRVDGGHRFDWNVGYDRRDSSFAVERAKDTLFYHPQWTITLRSMSTDEVLHTVTL